MREVDHAVFAVQLATINMIGAALQNAEIERAHDFKVGVTAAIEATLSSSFHHLPEAREYLKAFQAALLYQPPTPLETN